MSKLLTNNLTKFKMLNKIHIGKSQENRLYSV